MPNKYLLRGCATSYRTEYMNGYRFQPDIRNGYLAFNRREKTRFINQ